MNYKLLIQISLFVCFVLIIYITLHHYRSDPPDLVIKSNETSNTPKNIENKKSKTLKKNENILQNISYKNFDKEGNAYIINASEGMIANNNSNIINMNKVNAQIILRNYKPIVITSNSAIFDKSSFETKFSDSIQLNYLDHQINSEKLILLLNENLLKISEQVIYKNSTSRLAADKIVVDLITKDSKIFSKNNSKKIEILTRN